MSLDRPRPHAFSHVSENLDPGYFLPEPHLDADHSASETHHTTVVINNDWELLWEDAQFQFYNRATNVKQTVPTRATSAAIPDDDDGSIEGVGTPSLSQKLDALEAALLAGYFPIVVRLLLYGIDLSVSLFGSRYQTPLQWAVEDGNPDLVQLFLDHGAPVSCYPRAVTLAAAVKNGSRAIIEALLPRTGRKSSTIALGVAVSLRRIATAKLLLESGVHCDFEEGDRPHPQTLVDVSQYLRDISEPDKFRAPLIYAILLGDIDLARLLLSYGANPNMSHHDAFQCGMAIELAMKLGQSEIVHLLLDYGADVYLAHRVWNVPEHKCYPMTRPLYQKVAAGLRAIIATRADTGEIVD